MSRFSAGLTRRVTPCTGRPLMSRICALLKSAEMASLNQRRISGGGVVRMALSVGLERTSFPCAKAVGGTKAATSAVNKTINQLLGEVRTFFKFLPLQETFFHKETSPLYKNAIQMLMTLTGLIELKKDYIELKRTITRLVLTEILTSHLWSNRPV